MRAAPARSGRAQDASRPAPRLEVGSGYRLERREVRRPPRPLRPPLLERRELPLRLRLPPLRDEVFRRALRERLRPPLRPISE
jgi:hypothetical protein